MIDLIFNICVNMLFDLAKFTGLTYRQINVLIFFILWPAFTLFLVILVRRRGRVIKKLESQIKIDSETGQGTAFTISFPF